MRDSFAKLGGTRIKKDATLVVWCEKDLTNPLPDDALSYLAHADHHMLKGLDHAGPPALLACAIACAGQYVTTPAVHCADVAPVIGCFTVVARQYPRRHFLSTTFQGASVDGGGVDRDSWTSSTRI